MLVTVSDSFRLATAPARWLRRFHGGLRQALAADAVTFAGTGATLFAMLAVLAVAYPILASVAHGMAWGSQRAEAIVFARSPLFETVYLESLPFMIAASGLGVFSPALGVLFVLVFGPADLLAASFSEGNELRTIQAHQPWPAAYAARCISYGLLWILAVEIPILSRRWAAALAGPPRAVPAWAVSAGVRAVAMAGLVFVWASAAPYLIRPVFTWTVQAQLPPVASGATWLYWWVLVLAAAVLGGVSGLWPSRVRESASAALESFEPVLSRAGVPRLLRQVITIVIAIFLLSGILTSWALVGVFAAGAIVAGPVLDRLLPRIRVPGFVRSLSPAVRFVFAFVVTLLFTRLGVALAGEAALQDNSALVLLIAVGAPLYRFILDVGTARDGFGDWLPPGPGSAWMVMLALGVLGAAWLASPPLLWADNCPDDGGCIRSRLAAAAAMLGGAAAAIANGMRDWSFDRSWWAFKRAVNRATGGVDAPPVRPYASGVRG
jgi:hypothetical protein